MTVGTVIRRTSVYSCLALMAPALASAQTDSVTIVAGANYDAAGLKASLLGRDYRDLWTAPIRVPVLDLETYAAGLTPAERGGGLQTISLRFSAGDGREYNFRSVDKNQGGGLHPDFQNTFVDRMAQDQVSSKHPMGALIASPLLEAAGVLHAVPRLFVMPDDARLGEFREEFAGMLGFIEVHTNEGEDDQPGFAGAERVADAETLLEHLEESPEHRVDARGYLRGRLMDFLIGDWDRHLGQWRWGRYERDGVYVWEPIPEDRDNAFSSFDGLLLAVARAGSPHLQEFEAEYPSLIGMTNNAQVLDRQLLSELPREIFSEVAIELQRRLPDEIIERAVANTPPEYFALRGAELIRKLKSRRDALPDIAERFYDQLAREVDVWATDESERMVAVRLQDGSVELRLYADSGANDAEPYFQRRFVPGETREIRVHLRGGDDHAIVRGDGSDGLNVRVLGGGDDDVLVDSTSAGGALTAFYDDRGDNLFTTFSATVVDTREFSEPEGEESGFNENAPAYRDWGMERQWFRPWADWRYNAGPVVGGGPRVTRYGFRRVPYASRIGLRALYAPLHTRFGVELDADYRRTNSPSRVSVQAHATQLEVTRFHGFGNETTDEGPADLYKIWESQLRASVSYHRQMARGLDVFVGPEIQFTRPELESGGPADRDRPFGSEEFGQVGALAGAVVDTRDLSSFPRAGVHIGVTASAYPGVWDAPGAFGDAEAFAATYLPVPLPLETTLALRLGGKAAWGDFPFQNAAFLGGSGSLRGTPRQRFAGEAAAYGGAELRTFLTRFNFISRGDLGVIALADAGRVFVDGESSDEWHTGFGGGVWVGILDRTRTVSLVFAEGTERALYLELGMPF